MCVTMRLWLQTSVACDLLRKNTVVTERTARCSSVSELGVTGINEIAIITLFQLCMGTNWMSFA